jgi:alanine racemase
MLPVAELALASGADWLGVHSLEEGVKLREAGIQAPILVVGYIPLADLKEAVLQDLRMTVYNRETVAKLAEICPKVSRKAWVHIKLETGTYRQGVNPEDVLSFAQGIKENPLLVLEGISSHFANIEDTTDHTYAQVQLDNFMAILNSLREKGIDFPIKHMSCSAASILFPETFFDMVRIGIAMYGLWPSKETYIACLLQKREPLILKPVLAWKARVAQIKHVPKGAMIGYGCTYKSGRQSRLAVIPVGYYDGYPRSLSNTSFVLINGERAPLRGRVAMDFIVTEVTDIPDIKLENTAVLIGEDGNDRISTETMASWAGTINYEIVTRINSAVPRVVV